VLTLSPPPSLDPKWYKGTLPYTLAKMGMSFATIGLAQDFKEFGIAANALWPRTAIDTAAIRYELGGNSVVKHCRTTDIVADAAHAILTRDAKTCTGNFFLDDDVLTEEGITDLTPYAIEPGQPLILDFYLDSGPGGSMDGYLRMPV
jgi:citronellol/citronellal dehydrogenase